MSSANKSEPLNSECIFEISPTDPHRIRFTPCCDVMQHNAFAVIDPIIFHGEPQVVIKIERTKEFSAAPIKLCPWCGKDIIAVSSEA
ncbi:MAG: hypothetical protein WCR96_06210 [Candidatus Methanomethylophilaceae archaeon]